MEDLHPPLAGLANRVVPNGHSLNEAISLAEELCQFPQHCLRADRSSAFTHALSSGGGDPKDALTQEYRNGVTVLHKESVQGARQFSAGKGKHGKFN